MTTDGLKGMSNFVLNINTNTNRTYMVRYSVFISTSVSVLCSTVPIRDFYFNGTVPYHTHTHTYHTHTDRTY
ncbi:hypothetical protein HanRHA438_Chr11g0500121 [Helianthus annuus]|nr:hypothetical protein HanRHA438_Chr11g0500121 [Helianthus annuus]